jgi:hypothetical protein
VSDVHDEAMTTARAAYRGAFGEPMPQVSGLRARPARDATEPAVAAHLPSVSTATKAPARHTATPPVTNVSGPTAFGIHFAVACSAPAHAAGVHA